MRKLGKIAISLIAVGSLMFAGTSSASADDLTKPGKAPSVSSTQKSDKSSKTEKKAKKAKKAKKQKKNKKANKVKKAKKNTRVANFSPIINPTPSADLNCDSSVDACETKCDPMIDKLCQPIAPDCDPSVDGWCQIVIDPLPPVEPIIDPMPSEEPTVTPIIDPIVDPKQCWEYNSAAWNKYNEAITKANSDYTEFVFAAQADFNASTVDARAALDEAYASATNFAQIVEAKTQFRLATEVQQAKLNAVLADANEAVAYLSNKAYEQLVADGGNNYFYFGGGTCYDYKSDVNNVDPLPPVSELENQSIESNHNDKLEMHSFLHIGKQR